MTEPVAIQGPEPEPERKHVVYDAHYARPAEVSAAAVAADPQRFQPLGAQSVRMVGPDGFYDVPALQAEEARAKAGYQYLPDDEAAKQGQIQFWHDHYAGAHKVGVEEFANQMLFGVPDALEQHRETPEQRAGHQAAKRESGTARLIGGGLGVLGGAVLTAGAGEAAQAFRGSALGAEGLAAGRAAAAAATEQVAPGLLSRVMGATARSAAEGAAFATPAAAAHLSYGDVGKAAEAVGWGLGTGAILGLAGSSLAEASRAAKAKAAELAERVPSLSTLAPTAEQAASARAAAAAELAEHSTILDKAIGNARTSYDREAAKRAQAMGVKPSDLAGKIQGQLLDTRPGLAGSVLNPSEQAMRDAAGDAVKAVAQLGDGPVAFGELQALRSKLAAEAVGASPRANVMRQVDAIVGAEQQRAMAQAYGALPLKSDYADFLATLEKAQGAMGSAVALGGPSKAAQWVGGKLADAATNAVAGATGGVLGGVLGGGFVGAVVGQRVVNPLVKRILGSAVERHGTDLAGRVLGKIARNESVEKWFGAAFTKAMVDGSARKTRDGVRGLSGATGATLATKAPDKFVTPDDVIERFVGKKAKSLTTSQQWSRVVQSIVSSQVTPDRVAAERAAVAEVFAHEPELAAAVDQQMQRQNAYLQSVVAKHVPPPDSAPFRGGAEPELTATQKAPIARAIEIAESPHAALGHVQAGSLSKDHVEALKAMYPQHHAELVAEVSQLAADPEAAARVPLGVRLGLEKLTGVPVTNPRGVNFQAVYRGPQAMGQGHGQKGVPKPRPARRPAIEYPGLETGPSRIEHKEH